MKRIIAISANLLLIAALPLPALAGTYLLNFSGPGVSGTAELTYGTATDAKYPQAFEVTGISGTFSYSNNGLNIVNATIGSLLPIMHDTPEATNLLAPHNFSRFAVATGLNPENNGSLSYDNLYYPGGSPQTASDYPFHGGVLDIYGLAFNIGGGRVVNLWSNGDTTATGHGPFDYGVAVATQNASLDYLYSGVSAVPEPSTFALSLAGFGLLGLTFWRRGRA